VKLGYVNVDRMLRSITRRQFEEWKLYASLEPFDEEREDLRTASIVQTIAEVHRNPRKRRKSFSLDDLRLRFGDTPPRAEEAPMAKTWQQQKQIALGIATMFGVKIHKAA
jgi:hypothetical protein